jgi:hypothetical protein
LHRDELAEAVERTAASGRCSRGRERWAPTTAHFFRWASMNARTTLGLLALISLCGCRTPPKGAPTDLGYGFRREGHPAFTSAEQRIVLATRQQLEQFRGRRIDAYYRVSHQASRYTVLALEVFHYRNKQPTFRVGGDWFVDVNEDGTVTHVQKGL